MIHDDEQARKIFRKLKFANFMWGFSWAFVVVSAISLVFEHSPWLSLLAFVLNGVNAIHYNPYKNMVATSDNGKLRITMKGEKPNA